MANDNLVQLSGARRVDNIGGASPYHTVGKSSVTILCRGICPEFQQNFGDLVNQKYRRCVEGLRILDTAAAELVMLVRMRRGKETRAPKVEGDLTHTHTPGAIQAILSAEKHGVGKISSRDLPKRIA